MVAPRLAWGGGLRWLVNALLSATLAGGAPATVRAGENETAEDPHPIETESLDVVDESTILTDTLQGRDGVRIQSLCTHCNSANVQLGGLSEDLVPLSRDGFPLIGGLQASLVLSNLPSDAIAGARVTKGPGAAELPNTAAGGEIAFNGASAGDLAGVDLFAESGSWSLRRGLALVAGQPASWVEGSFALGTAEADLVDDDGDGWTDVPAVDRRYFDGRLDLSPAPSHSLGVGVSWIDEDNVEGRGAFDAFRYVTEGQDGWTREDMSFNRTELRADWEWRPGAGGALGLRLLEAQRSQSVHSQLTAVPDGFSTGADRLIERFAIDEQDRWGQLFYERPLGLEWRVAAGFETNRQRVAARNREPLEILDGGTVTEARALESVDVHSAYVDVGWNHGQAWDVQFGLRWDEALGTTALSAPAASATARRWNAVSPRLTARAFLGRGWTLRLVAGRTFRPPRPILSAVCCGQRYQTVENVEAERATTLGFEASYEPTPRLRAGAYVARTGFHDHILRVVGWSQAFIQTYALTNVPEATADRAELSLAWTPLPRVTLDGSIGWLSFHNDRTDKVDVIVSPPSRTAVEVVPISIGRIPYRPVRWSSISVAVRLPAGAQVSAQAGYTGTMPIQQFTRLPSNSELDTETLRDSRPFWLVGIRARIPLGRRVALAVAIDNLTHRLQDDLGDPTTDYNWGPLAGRSWRAGLRVRL